MENGLPGPSLASLANDSGDPVPTGVGPCADQGGILCQPGWDPVPTGVESCAGRGRGPVPAGVGTLSSSGLLWLPASLPVNGPLDSQSGALPFTAPVPAPF